MVHDTENLTFSEEFRGCSVQTPADSSAVRRGSSTGWLRIFCAGDTNLLRIRVENGGNQKNFVRNKAEGLRKTMQGSFELSS